MSIDADQETLSPDEDSTVRSQAMAPETRPGVGSGVDGPPGPSCLLAALDCHSIVRSLALGLARRLPLVGVGGLLTKGTPSDIVLPVAGGAGGESPRRPHPISI